MDSKPKALLFGASNCGKAFLEECGGKYEIVACADNDSDKHGTVFHGVPVISPEGISSCEFDLVIVTSMFFPEIRRQLVDELGIAPEVIDHFDHTRTKVELADRLRVSLEEGRKLARTGATTSVSLRPMHRTFHQHRVRSTRVPQDWWEFVATVGLSTGLESLRASSDVIERTKMMNPETLETYEWLAVYAFLTRMGLFHLAHAVRDLARRRALMAKSDSCTEKELRMCLAAALELREIEMANEILILLEHKLTAPDLCRFSRFLLSMYQGAPVPEKDRLSETDSVYRDYINDCSIAIVAPATTESQDAHEIDSHDRVIRINYRESGKGCDPVSKGMRCDITYFNGEQALNLLESRTRVPQEASWAVFKRLAHQAEYEARHRQASTRTRAFDSVSAHLFNGTLNALPNVVLDLLRFGPRVIKVFHADLMLTIDRFKGYYPQEFRREDKMGEVFRKGSVTHDPVTQYEFLSNLWSADRIVGDRRFDEVMALGCEEYMRQLQTVYFEPQPR